MAEIETKLRVSAVADNTIQKNFRDIAAQVEAMSARVTKSQRTVVAEHKAAADDQLNYVVKELESSESKAGALLKSVRTPEEGARAATSIEPRSIIIPPRIPTTLRRKP